MKLIEPIPDDVPVEEILVETSCTMVRAGGAAGLPPTRDWKAGRICGGKESTPIITGGTLCSGAGTEGGRLPGYRLRIYSAGHGLHLYNRVHAV